MEAYVAGCRVEVERCLGYWWFVESWCLRSVGVVEAGQLSRDCSNASCRWRQVKKNGGMWDVGLKTVAYCYQGSLVGKQLYAISSCVVFSSFPT